MRVSAQSRAGDPVSIDANYLIGCDGGNSAVRKQMGVALLGDAEIARMRTTFVRCPELINLFPGKPAWMTWVFNPRIAGTVVAIDGEALWLIHRTVPRSMDSYEALDFDRSVRDVLGVNEGFGWERISHQDWTGRRLVAANFRQGNVFLAGDAAQLWIPFAGYGMNAGIADGANLAWMLAAVLNGHADENLLAAHEAERHPITEQVSRLAMGKALEYMESASRRSIPPALEGNGLLGRLLRKRVGRKLIKINAPQFACEGLNFGYYYDQSPASLDALVARLKGAPAAAEQP